MYSRRVVLGGGAACVSLLAGSGLKAQGGPLSYEIPLKLEDERLVMEATINGRGPLGMVLDTGGQLSLIDASQVAPLGLRPAGRMRLGIGGAGDHYDLYQADNIVFGGRVRQPNPTFASTANVGFRGANAGSLASGFLAAMDSEIDFKALKLRLFPNGGPPRDGWHRHERTLAKARVDGLSPHFFAEAAIGDVRFRPLLDTGAPPPLIVYPALARRLNLDPDANWSPGGIRRGAMDRIVRADRPLRLGQLTIERPLLTLRGGDQFGVDALVGLPILQQLDLATDIKANRLYSRPNGRPAPPPKYNMSGLRVEQRGGAIVAQAVGRGSPAEASGVRVGDRIEGVDFQTMIAALNGRVGSMVRLAVAGKPVELVLRDYL